jgi:hypothetical protein
VGIRQVGTRPAARRWLRLLLAALPPLVLFALFVVTGFRGIDFGYHWDEVDWQLKPVQEMVQTGLLMPRAAIYPAFAKWLILWPSLLRGVAKALEVGLEPRIVQGAMIRAITAPDYLLTARRLFVVVSALTIVWVYLAALVMRLKLWQATVAAAVMGLSWEFAYHSRWVATDCIVVQFSALTLLLLSCFLRYGRVAWLYSAAVATGLAIGTKWPTVPLLVPVLVCGAWQLPRRRVAAQLLRALLLGGTAFLAYLVSTPATVLEPFTFVELIRFISSYYAHGHYGYSVKPGWDHFSKVMTYFAISYFSPYPALSVPLFLGVLAGGVIWVRRERKQGVLLAGFPLVFLAFFCLQNSALIVRNYLLIAPFFALLLARAAGALVDWLPRPWLRASVFAALSAIGVLNAAWLVQAAESIRHASLERDMEQAIQYLAQQPASRYRLSPRLAHYATKHQLPRGQTAKDPVDHVAFLARAEGPDLFKWPANDPWQAERVFGPLEVNFDWYPSWGGADRVVVMSLAKAKEIGLPFLGR